MNKTLASIASAAALLALAAPVAAQSLRCKNDIANPGDSKSAVFLKCGEPVVKDSFCKPAAQPVPVAPGAAVAVVPCESVEEWTYKPGYGQFVTVLRFEGGTLASIKYGDRIK